MTERLKKITIDHVVLIILCLSACGEYPEYEYSPQPNDVGVFVHAGLALDIDAEILPWVEQFEGDLKRRGYETEIVIWPVNSTADELREELHDFGSAVFVGDVPYVEFDIWNADERRINISRITGHVNDVRHYFDDLHKELNQ